MKRKYLFLITLSVLSCSQKGKPDFEKLSKEDQAAYAIGYISKNLKSGEETDFSFVRRMKDFEDYIGTPIENLQEKFGIPIDTVIEKNVIEERDALVLYYEFPVSEQAKVYLKAATQYGKVVGLQLSSEPNAELLYSSSRFLLSSRGISLTPLASENPTRYAARTGDLGWTIGFEQTDGGVAGVVNVGTIKYMWCDLAWDTEDLWGTDGLGNKVDTTLWTSPVERKNAPSE